MSSPGESSNLGPSVRIDLHTSDPRTCNLKKGSQKGKISTKKLFAVLRPTSRRPFTSKHIVQVLANYPLSLFLSFPRIAFEAARLHYGKGLDVYARPAPRAADMAVERSLGTRRNPVQQDEKGARTQGSGVGWQPEGMLERYARRLVEHFLHARAQEMDIQIELVFADPSFGTRSFPTTSGKTDTLTIFVRSSQAFVFLFISPTPGLALALGQESEHHFTMSDANLFMSVFEVQQRTRGTVLARFAQRIRLSPLPKVIKPASTIVQQRHFLDSPFTTTRIDRIRREIVNIFALLLFYILLYTEKFIFTMFHARFVAGEEPWDIWTRVQHFVDNPKQL